MIATAALWLAVAASAPSARPAAASDDDDRSGSRGGDSSGSGNSGSGHSTLDTTLAAVLKNAGFTGEIESALERRLDRSIDDKLANLGRLLFFDTLHSLRHDNTCAGCHAPTNGFGDSQGIAIGVQNNGVVGPDRTGPRNQRRSPMVINTAFLPALMWNGRFNAPSGDPFDNSRGFLFPPPESDVRFPPRSRVFRHLLQAQAHIPPTETIEVAGFRGVCRPEDLGPGSPFCQFDDGIGDFLPLPDASGFRNEPIRQAGLDLLNAEPAYRQLFGELFRRVRDGGRIDFDMFGLAIAEFEFSLTFANAPIDRFARGNREAMTSSQKRGGLLFFGKANCVSCHAVAGDSNEMFSDFENRVAGVPQIAPFFGAARSNVIFDGPGADEDFGLEQVTGNPADRYKFRTAPLRNVALAPAFFHNGAFARLEDAIRFHLNPAQSYNPARAGIDRDLYARVGPRVPAEKLNPLFRNGGIRLSESEIRDVTQFVKTGLLDPRATKENLCRLVPKFVPSQQPVPVFEACAPAHGGPLDDRGRNHRDHD
jgi:cytochrome c peroxidase